MQRERIPLSKRPGDIVILVFFLVNILFITYLFDLEQLVIANPAHFTSYPLWPPRFIVDMSHSWARNFDPLILARPVWWKMTIWIDAIFFGPFYVVAIYAYSTGKEWIRIPSIIYSSVMLTNLTIILGEEYAGVSATPHFPIVLLENLAWILFPLFIIYRMWRYPHPFTRPVPNLAAGDKLPALAEPSGSAGGM
jgi:EXPERA (EXPanded EBP superfamily)